MNYITVYVVYNYNYIYTSNIVRINTYIMHTKKGEPQSDSPFLF